MFVNNFNNSIIFGFIFRNSDSEIYLVSNNNSNQYSVSFASFKPIDNLGIKSALLCACSDSLLFAPIEVPERNNYLDKTNSFFLDKTL